MNIKLEQYLLERGLVNPKAITEIILTGKGMVASDEILGDRELLVKVVGLNEANNREALEALIRMRLIPIVEALVVSCEPAETMVLRQAVVEMIQIPKDLDLIVAEDKRRKANERENNTPAVPAAEVSGERKKDDESPPGEL